MKEKGRASLGAASLRVLAFLVLTALLAAIIVVQQRASGAYGAQFSATQVDEAGHFVSGLMVADHLAQGLPAPRPFVQDYRARFPTPGLGQAPSLYYLAEGLWFSILSPSTPAALLLPAFICALLVVSAGWVATRAAGILPGIAVGAALMAAPAVRAATIVIGLDLPVALLSLVAALAYAAYLAHGKWRDALLFAFASVAAVLTKISGLALLLLPLLAVLIGTRAELVARASFWAPFPLIALVAAPWYFWGPAGVTGFAPWDTLDISAFASGVVARAGMIRDGVGNVFAILAIVGAVFAAVRGWRKAPGAALMVAISALAGAFLAFALVMPFPADTAHLLPLLPPVVILAAYGAMGLSGLISSGWSTLWGLVVALVLLLAALPGVLEPLRKHGDGMDEVAEAILARDLKQPVVVVGADKKGESALVAAMAQHDRRRRSFVIRGASKASGIATLSDPGAVLDRLDALAVSFLALDTAPAAQAHAASRHLTDAVKTHPDRFALIGAYPRGDGAGEVRLYTLSGHGDAPIRPAEMRRRLTASGS